MSTVVECTRSPHSMLILLVDVALLCLCTFPASGFITGFSPISGSVHSLSLSLWVRAFLFSLTRLRVIFLSSALCANILMFYLTHLWVCSLTLSLSLSTNISIFPHPPPGLLLGSHPSLGLFTHSLSLWVRTFLFSLTRLRVSLYFFFPLSVRAPQCSVSPISGLYSSLISNKPCVRVTLAARRTHFNNILESRGCSSHPYTRPFWLLFNNVTLGFTCHLSYLHTYTQPNNVDCRRVTFAQDLKNCFCTDARYSTASSTGLHTITYLRS
jgi:hypothetical protein